MLRLITYTQRILSFEKNLAANFQKVPDFDALTVRFGNFTNYRRENPVVRAAGGDSAESRYRSKFKAFSTYEIIETNREQ